jgi:hypothetical protein
MLIVRCLGASGGRVQRQRNSKPSDETNDWSVMLDFPLLTTARWAIVRVLLSSFSPSSEIAHHASA